MDENDFHDFLRIRVCAKAIAIKIYNVVHTMGKTKLGGVIEGRMHWYHGDFTVFMVPLGITCTINTVKNAIM